MDKNGLVEMAGPGRPRGHQAGNGEFAVAAQAAAADLQRAQAFLQAFFERAANGHRFADAYHLCGGCWVGLREFLEGKTRNLGDDVINAQLEAREGFARDVVLEFVEQGADGALSGDLRDGKPGNKL